MIDTHAHIDTEAFNEDRDEVIKRAIDSGVEKIIIPAIEPKAFNDVVKVADQNENVYFGIGVHPHNANELNDEVLNQIEEISSHNKCVAIGEIGLDYYYDFVEKDTQKDAFRKQLELAKKLNKPVIVHNRESDQDLLDIIEEKQDGTLKGVLHCFSSEEPIMNRAMDLGFNISFTGNITFKKFNLQSVVENVPEDRYMIETDSPYMAPVPNRGKRNEPAYVKLVAEKIAELKNIKLDEVLKMTTKTAMDLFKISVLLIFLSGTTLFSQEFVEGYDDEEYYEDEYLPLFSQKGIGIGPTLGSFTVVDTFLDNEQDISYEGQLGFGFLLDARIFDWLHLEGTYMFSENTEIQEEFDEVEEPNTYNFYEISAILIPNPHQRINFYAMLGTSILNESFYQTFENNEVISGEIVSRSTVGVNTGLGFMVNIHFDNAGVLSVGGEWKVNFIPESKTYNRDPRVPGGGGTVDFRSFYSIPRAKLIFYPKWFNF